MITIGLSITCQTMATENDLKYMRRAIELSEIAAKQGNDPFGAVIVKDGQVVAEGHNLIYTSVDITAHGEMTAIRNACKALNSPLLTGCVVYTSCEPCAMCTSALWLANIAKVFYATKLCDLPKPDLDHSGQFKDVGSPVGERSVPATQLCWEEGVRVVKEWWERKQNK